MRTVSAKWEANQLEIASDPGRINAFIETRGPEEAVRQVVASASVEHPGGTAVIGQIFTFSAPFAARFYSNVLSLTGWTTGDSLDLEVWSVDPVSGLLDTLIATGSTYIAGDFVKQETMFVIGDYPTSTTILGGLCAFLILAPPSGTLDVWYAIGDRYAAGNRVSGATHAAGSVLTETSGEDLAFRFIGNEATETPVWRWRASNDPAINNAVDAFIISAFDPSGATMPIESCSVTIENGAA